LFPPNVGLFHPKGYNIITKEYLSPHLAELKWREKMEYVYAAIALIVIIAIYLVVRKNSNDKRNCGKIACEPIVPVADRDETGVAEGERIVENDTVKAATEESCAKDE
jgi:hypothetical protein